MTQIGPKNRRVTFQSASDTTDSFGDAQVTWSDVATVWASVEQLRGGERFLADSPLADTTHRIRVLYNPTLRDLTPKSRIRLERGTTPEVYRYLDIKSFADLGDAHKEFEIYAQEIYE